MAHAHTLAEHGPARAGFTVAATAIPIGVLCRSCGRLHLPARLWPLAIRAGTDGGSEIDLRCVRCNAVGTLVLDGNDATHRGLLAVWRDQGDDAKAST